ncbi:MAG: hypothetical protein Q7K35_04580 [bacterium]|nr:hypothetical protein [bacterium]
MSIIKKLSLILLIIAMVVVLGYVINLSKNKQKSGDNIPIEIATTTEKFNNATSSEPVVATSTVENIDTKDWLSYRNKEYGFELKYPKAWDLKEGSRIQLGIEQNYIMISSVAEKSYLIIDKIDNSKIIVNKGMNVKMLDNITIGGYTTEIAYIENGLSQDLFYRYFLRTSKKNLQIYFVLEGNEEAKKSILYHIINTIKFDEF